CGYK
ncbi:hypothetical protein ACTFIW_007135, partial [Dictyostelium discoideum]